MKKTLITYLFTCLILLSCESQTWHHPKNFEESVFAIPDSLATKRQLDLKKKLLGIVVEKCIVKDNKLYLNADSNYFKSRKVSPAYINIINISLDETNNTIAIVDSLNFCDFFCIPTIMNMILENYKKQYDNLYK